MGTPSELIERVRANPYTTLALGIFLVATYLCLVNLDYAGLWHDEGPPAFIGKNLLERGDIVGWDGRNLVGGTNGRSVNDELRDVWPPLMYVLNAAGFAVFGVNEIGARIMHALVGILSLGVFWLLLRQHVRGHSRLLFFCFLFVAWSPQLLLYFRQSRYYAFMVLGVVAGFYLYERYWRTRNSLWLAALTLVATLSFFNHYTGGAATMLALAAWHLLFRARETTRREWVAFAACGLIVGALGLAYFAWLGVIGGERSGYFGYAGVAYLANAADGGIQQYGTTISRFFFKLWIYARDLFTTDWISWPVFLWFIGMLFLVIRKKRADQRRRPPRVKKKIRNPKKAHTQSVSKEEGDDNLPVTAVGGLVLMGALFALFAAMLSMQKILDHPADLRYYVGALPLLLVMKGLFTEWTWRTSKLAGAVVIAVLLFTSAGAAPFNMTMAFTGERTLGPHFFQFVQEIHRPYHDSIREVSNYLLQHAEQNDLVHVPEFADREVLVFYTGHRVRFCCILDQGSHLSRARIEEMGAYLAVEGTIPDWIIIFGPLSKTYWEQVNTHYVLAKQLDVYSYPTQRPELNWHAFTPLPPRPGVYVLRRKESP